MLMVKLPELPPKNPFFSLNNARQIGERMKGLQVFLELILQSSLMLSDSCLHLFLQSDLSVDQMEACAAGRTHYSVAQAVQRCGCALRRFNSHEDQQEDSKASFDSDSDCLVFEASSEAAETTTVMVHSGIKPNQEVGTLKESHSEQSATHTDFFNTME